jgi:cytochrome o ubiquinol oxidase subunit 2
MKKKLQLSAIILPPIIAVAASVMYIIRTKSAVIMHPAGQIGDKQQHLIIITLLLSLVVVVPVYLLTAVIVWRYHETNTKARYTPDNRGNNILESIWWLIPLCLITVLAIITWNTSHSLNPYKPIASSKKAINIQVIALQWKWLFIYPDQHIATVNYLQFPSGTPVNFQITSDAPMNSFWIPQLGGQIYAMSGMSTQLHLMADHDGIYQGVSANISGAGFADMHFTARSTSPANFGSWVQKIQRSPLVLDTSQYAKLANADRIDDSMAYSSVENSLYDTVVMKYMGMSGSDGKSSGASNNNSMNEMDMDSMDMSRMGGMN